jgi:hypothetical protein
MKKWHGWAFVMFLVAMAAAGGWLKAQRGATFADTNIETNQG